MAKTLMDNIRQKLEQPQQQPGTAAPVGGVQDQTERTQGLLRAKLGKAGGQDTGPRLSNIQEQQAAKQTRLGAERLATQGAVQSQQLAQQEEATRVQEQESLANLMEQREDVVQRFELQSESIAKDLERNMKQMDDREKQAKMEQLAFTLRFQDQQYVTELQRAGERARLNDNISFKEQLARENFQDMEDLVRSEVGYKKIADMSRREFQEELNRMDMQYAQEMAHQAQVTQMKQQKYKMMTGGLQAGTQAYGSGAFQKGGAGAANTGGGGAAGGGAAGGGAGGAG